MNINTDTLVSISEANQNFSKVTRVVDQYGKVVILKNNTPKYVIVPFEDADSMQMASDDEVDAASEKLMQRNKKVYEALAK